MLRKPTKRRLRSRQRIGRRFLDPGLCISVRVMERVGSAADHQYRVLGITPGAVRIDVYLDPEFDGLECILEKWSRADAETVGVAGGNQLEFLRLSACLSASHDDLGARNRKC